MDANMSETLHFKNPTLKSFPPHPPREEKCLPMGSMQGKSLHCNYSNPIHLEMRTESSNGVQANQGLRCLLLLEFWDYKNLAACSAWLYFLIHSAQEAKRMGELWRREEKKYALGWVLVAWMLWGEPGEDCSQLQWFEVKDFLPSNKEEHSGHRW